MSVHIVKMSPPPRPLDAVEKAAKDGDLEAVQKLRKRARHHRKRAQRYIEDAKRLEEILGRLSPQITRKRPNPTGTPTNRLAVMLLQEVKKAREDKSVSGDLGMRLAELPPLSKNTVLKWHLLAWQLVDERRKDPVFQNGDWFALVDQLIDQIWQSAASERKAWEEAKNKMVESMGSFFPGTNLGNYPVRLQRFSKLSQAAINGRIRYVKKSTKAALLRIYR